MGNRPLVPGLQNKANFPPALPLEYWLLSRQAAGPHFQYQTDMEPQKGIKGLPPPDHGPHLSQVTTVGISIAFRGKPFPTAGCYMVHGLNKVIWYILDLPKSATFSHIHDRLGSMPHLLN